MLRLLSRQLVIAALSAMTLIIGVQPDQDGAGPMVPARVEPAPVFKSQATHEVGGGVSEDTYIFGSPVVFDASGKPVRVLSGLAVCRVGQVTLQQDHYFRQVDASSSEPVRFNVGPVMTGIASALAAQVLGTTDPREIEAFLESGETVPPFAVEIAPKPGLVWGDVTLASDLVESVVPSTR